jgi:uncharacterized membrane protein YbhN (UPF0104 family)
MSRSRRLSVVLGLALTALFLWLAARNVDFLELRLVLSAARWRWLLVMAALALSDIFIRALRWRLLLSQAVSAPLSLLFRLQAVGLAVNNVLFARLGELARAALAARELRLPLPTTLASVAVERALDVAALLSLFALASSAAAELVAVPVRQAAGLLLAGAVSALLFLIMAEKSLELGGSLEVRLRPWPKAHRLIEQLALGAAVLKRPAAALPIIFLSLCLWLNGAFLYWAAARALGLGGLMDMKRSILVLSWAGAGAALPAAPGAIGTFEAMVKAILEKFGASPNEAFGYAVFVHMTTYLLVTALGLAFLSRIGFSLAGLRSSLEEKP